jgi:hypothetical protein
MCHFGTKELTGKPMSTALTVVGTLEAEGTPEAEATSVRGSPPRADFLAQLIATAAQVPQVRTRCRAEPEEAVAVYGTSNRAPSRARVLSRSL